MNETQSNTVDSPMNLFKDWCSHFYEHKLPIRDGLNAILSTIQPNNTPHSRAVFIYKIDYNKIKFLFITNILTSKCNDIRYNSNVSLSFILGQKQITVNGTAIIGDSETNCNVWNNRTNLQHISSWKNYNMLKVVHNTIENSNITQINSNIRMPKVPNWGVVSIIPKTFDFSQEESTSNIYVRYHYYLNEKNIWTIARPLVNMICCTDWEEVLNNNWEEVLNNKNEIINGHIKAETK